MARGPVFAYSDSDILREFMKKYSAGIYILVHGANLYLSFLKEQIKISEQDIKDLILKDYALFRITDMEEARTLAKLSALPNSPFIEIWVDGERWVDNESTVSGTN